MTQRLGGGGSPLDVSTLATARLGANWYPLNTGEGEWWRLVTAVFLHGGFIHLLFNTWVLIDLVRFCEQVYGAARIVSVYLLTGVAGNLVSLLWYGTHFHNVGASGALCGLIGLMAVYGLGRRGDLGAAAVRRAMGRWLMYIVVLGFLLPGIDNAAHLGGAGAGAALGLVLAGRPAQRGRAWTRFVWRPLAAILVVATLGSFGAMIASQSRWSEAEQLASAILDADRFRDAWRADVVAAKDPGPRTGLKEALLDFTERPAPAPELGAAREAVTRAARARDAGEGPPHAVEAALARYEEALADRAARNRFRVELILALRTRPD